MNKKLDQSDERRPWEKTWRQIHMDGSVYLLCPGGHLGNPLCLQTGTWAALSFQEGRRAFQMAGLLAAWAQFCPVGTLPSSIFPNCGLGFLASTILERYAEVGRCLKMKYLKQCRKRGNGLIITWKDPHSGLCQTKWNRITAWDSTGMKP